MSELMPKVGREAAHILIDALSAYDLEADDVVDTQVMELALERLSLAGCVTVELDENSSMAMVGVENLAMPALLMMQRLIREVTLLAEAHRDEAIALLRDAVDGRE